jgi:hypothetical protein
VSLLDRLRKRDQPSGNGQTSQVIMPHLRVLRASGQRIDLSARDVGTRITATRQGWQTDAWDYFGRIGELSYALRLLAQQVAKVRFYAAELRPYPDDPAELSGKDHELDDQLAADAVSELERLPLDDDGVDGFLATLTLNLLVAGEAWIHGQVVDGEEQWVVRSISEITAHGDQVMLAELPTTTSLGQRPILQGEEELLRCWIRSPRYGQLAISPLFSPMDVMEGIVLDGREGRVASQSRIGANGILLVPDSLSLVKVRQDSEDLEEESVQDDSFMGDLTEAITAPIINEGHAGAIAPIVIRGEAEALKEVRHIKLDRADPEKLTERQTAGVLRLLKSIDIQPEQVEGVGTANHWSAWTIEAKDVKQQVEPWSATIAGCLTKAFLRPALLSLDHDREQVRRVAVWRDVSSLVENPNRGQDARDAHDRLVISDEALRQALGFDDDDAPDEDEVQRRIAAKVGVDQGTAAIVLEMVRRTQGDQPRVIEAQQTSLPSGQPANGSRPVAQPGEVVPERPIPQEPTSTTEPDRRMVASAQPENMPADIPSGWRVDVETARMLADVDAALAERIIVAADAAIQRAVERAGGRARSAVRNQARSDLALTAAIDGVPAELIPGRVGRDVLLATTTLPDLLADAFTRLRGQFLGWISQAADQVASLVLRLLGIPRRSTEGQRIHDVITTRLSVHRDDAWIALAEALDNAAAEAMFRADPMVPEQVGRGEEPGSLISPAAVTRALVIAGGGDPDRPGDGGLGSGSVVRDMLTEQNAVTLGWEWQYRPERSRNMFTPHAQLDGARFTTWTDPQLETDEESRWIGEHFRPNDHHGCRCVAFPLVATPNDDPDGIVARRLREARGSDRGRTLTKVAAEDTAAGRIGTSVQREVEVRDRIAADVERLRQHYIEGAQA